MEVLVTIQNLQAAGFSRKVTNHQLRATAINHLIDNGFDKSQENNELSEDLDLDYDEVDKALK